MERAAEHGVGKLMNPSINLQSSRDSVALADNNPSVYAAVGIHPNEPVQLGGEMIRTLRQLAQHPKVAAIGEIGLDYYRNQVPRGDQARRFRAQLDLAAELGLPVIIHCREAYADTCDIVEHWRNQRSLPLSNLGVFHSFSGDQNDAQAVLELGFFLGITGPVTFPKAKSLRRIVANVPLDRLLIETDAPFLAPQQRRGKRNEPSYVRWTADRIAAERGLDINTLTSATTKNAVGLFAWDDPR